MTPERLILLYGPPFSGKSSLGRAFAAQTKLPFWDADRLIEERSGMSIAEIFSGGGEESFRRQEAQILQELVGQPEGVVALGGGALLDKENRDLVEKKGEVYLLEAEREVLMERMRSSHTQRPLLKDSPAEKLHRLLRDRETHYQSFPRRISTTGKEIEELVLELETRTGLFFLSGLGEGYPVRIQEGILEEAGEMLRREGLTGPVIVVSDENVSALYARGVVGALQAAGYQSGLVVVSPGEASKSVSSLQAIWDRFLALGLERGGTVPALGGGVVGDLAGFAAATIFRGISWVNLPSSLLAMVDAAVGGKTGINLSQGKNLVGCFHAPRFVGIDPGVLSTLPEDQRRSGMAEVIKHGMIADPALWELAARGPVVFSNQVEELICRAVAVKAHIVRKDPYEKHIRQALNFGHTIGHAVEKISGFQLCHGEAVAVGMVAETYLAELLGLAKTGLSGELIKVLDRWDLPTRIPGAIGNDEILKVMDFDKKKTRGKVRLALPLEVGEVRVGLTAEAHQLRAALDCGKRGKHD